MEFDKLTRLDGIKGKKKRRGRGAGSGKGNHTTGTGNKGQKSRAGHSLPFGFEGGQVPLYKKLPKLGGFRSVNRKQVASVNISDLASFKEGAVVQPQDLSEKGIIRYVPRHGVKVLAKGEISKKLTLKGFSFSGSAREKLEKAGCIIE